MSDEFDFDGAVAASLTQSKAQEARIGFAAATDTNPDAYAEDLRIARRTGLPTPTVAALPLEAKRQDAIGRIDFDTLAQTAPATAALLADTERAKLAHDDTDNMSGVESALSFLGGSAKAGLNDLVGAGAKLVDAVNPFTTSDSDAAVLFRSDPEGLARFRDQSLAGGLSRFARGRTEASKQNMAGISPGAQARYGDLQYATTEPGKAAYLSPVKMVGDAIRSLPTTAALALTTYLTRGAAIQAEKQALAGGATAEVAQAAAVEAATNIAVKFGAASEGAIGYAQNALQTQKQVEGMPLDKIGASPAYQALIEQGYDPNAARMFLAAQSGEQAGIGAGFTDAITNAIGGKFLGRIIGEGGQLLPRIGKGFANEAGVEFVQSGGEQLFQNMAIKANADPSQSLSDGVLESMLQGLFVGGLTGGAMSGVIGRSREREQQAQQAEPMAQGIEQLNRLAEASKLRQRDPETFSQFVADAAENGPVQHVFIDAQTLAQSGLAEQVAALSPAVAEQYQTALETGGQLRIPVAEYAATIAGSEFAQPLLEHLKIEPDGFSRAEAQEYMQSQADTMRAEVERVMAEKQGDDTFKASRDAVKADIKTQLDTANRFKPDVNDAYASMVGNFYAVTAAKMGLTPEALFQRYPLTVNAQGVAGAGTLDQGGTLGALRQQWTDAGLKGDVSEKDGVITLSRIVVPEGERGTGKGTAAMQDLVDYADRTGQHVALTPSSDFGGNKKRLVQFYKRFGFVENKGKNRAFTTSESMYRQAQGKVLHQSVFHGTPYHFDKFSLEHMGTGEGAQAYGWGLYFAGGKEVAEYYRSQLSLSKTFIDRRADGDFYIARVSDPDGKPVAGPFDTKLGAQAYRDEGGDLGGQLYEAEIPEDEVMLHWDKPLSEQPAKVRGAVKAVAAEYGDLLGDVDLKQSIADNESGEAFYRMLSRVTGSDKNASRDLNRHGASGIRYLDGTSRNQNLEQKEAAVRLAEKRLAMAETSGDADRIATWKKTLGERQKELDGLNYNYVVFDDAAIEILNTYYQNKQGNRGAFNPATLSITLLKNADLSTFLHESGHFFLEVTADIAARADAPVEIRKDMDALLHWFGVADIQDWHNLEFEEKRSYHEQFARGFEAYLFEGKAPNIELQSLFQRFRAWMLNVYKELKALNVELTPEVRQVFDRMLATTEEIQLAEQGRSMLPLFETAEQAGMAPEDFAAYQALGTEATADAIEELQARGLRDLQWLRNAKGREVKKLQKESRTKRAVVEMGVRREVMSQPLYRAWQFLTDKVAGDDKLDLPTPAKSHPDHIDPSIDSLFAAIAKLGGLKRAEVESQWGFDKKEKTPQPGFGKPLLRREGGRALDLVAEELADLGYLNRDEQGQVDVNELESKFHDELNGAAQYSYQYDYHGQQAPGARDLVRNPGALGAGRLDITEVNALLPPELSAKLVTRKMTAATGLHPDVVSDLFGFTSGDELMRALADATPPVDEINALTDQRMLEQYGDLSSPEAIDRAADKAIHNDARARFVTTEHNALAKATGRPKVLAAAARQFAAAMIARLKVRDIKPGQYAAAEVRAAKAAQQASKKGDTANAATEKRNQLINLYATRAAQDAQDEVRKTLDYFKRFDTVGKSLDVDYREQVEALLERFDLRKGQTNKATDKRKSLAAWVEAERERGLEPDIPDALLNEATRKSVKDMTLEELRGLRDTVAQIEHLGRLKSKLLTAQDQREYAAVRDEIVGSIEQHAGDRVANTRTATTNTGRIVSGLKRFWAAHIKVAIWSRIMDGGRDGGPMWEYFIRSANAAADRETVARANATQQLSDILAPVLALGKMGGKGQFFPGIKRSLNRESRLAIALNVGNEGNLQRLLGGEGWTGAQLKPVLDSLTAAEWQAVQAVWDHFEQYRPQIAAKERRVYGKEPNWVEPRAFTVTLGQQQIELRGGYYPIKYDPAASERAEAFADAEDAKRQLQGAYTSATTRRSFTKARADEVSGRPLLYTLAGMYSGVNDVIHDLSWHEWLIDANRLLRSKSIDGAIRNHYGPEVKQQFKSWVQDVAEGERGAANAGEAMAARLRQHVSVAGLGFNLVSALMQPLGLSMSISRIGTGWVGRGLSKYISSPLGAMREANEKSAFMEMRARTQFRELNELRNRVQDQSSIGSVIQDGAYILMTRCQQMVDVPTWHGAYLKALAEGNADERAVALADQAVIDAQGGGMTKDLSAIERGNPAVKLFTVFYSFMNTTLNMGVAQTMTANSKAKLMADYLLIFVVPAVLGALLKSALTPGGGDDDWDKLARKLIGEQLGFMMGLMVGTREAGDAAKTVAGVNDFAMGYRGPAGLRVLSDASTLATQAHQGDLDDAFRKALINTMGSLFGFPAAQINRTVTGAKALAEGKTHNPLAIGFGFQEKR
jgi:GNAT superfamily N-acetyltransferase